MYWDDFEITKREVLASIAIIAVLLSKRGDIEGGKAAAGSLTRNRI